MAYVSVARTPAHHLNAGTKPNLALRAESRMPASARRRLRVAEQKARQKAAAAQRKARREGRRLEATR